MLDMGEEWQELEGPGSIVPYRTVVCSLTIPHEPDPVTTFIITALAAAFAAFCVWLTVRIVNRRERWAKWTLAVMLGFTVLYVLSVGPACWMSSRANAGASAISTIYWPLTQVLSRSEWAREALSWYSGIGAARNWTWAGGTWGIEDVDGLDRWLYSPKARVIISDQDEE